MAVPAPDLGSIHHIAHLARTQAPPPFATVHRSHVLSLHRSSGGYGLGDENLRLAGGCLMLLPSGDRDDYRLTGRDIAWWCQFDGALVRGVRGGAELTIAEATHRRSRARMLSSSEDRTAGAWFRDMLAAWRQGTPISGLRVRARVLDLLSLWAAPAGDSVHADAVDQLRLAIEQRACEADLPLSHLGHRIGESVDAITTAFKHRFGYTPVAYRTRQRLLHACELLVHDPHPLSEIAKRCGFSDAGYLCRVFRQHFGHSPRAYARRCAGKVAEI